jgi:hypothetical protein
MSAVYVVAVGCAPSASMRWYTFSAAPAWPLRLHAFMMVLYVRTSGAVPCGAATPQTQAKPRRQQVWQQSLLWRPSREQHEVHGPTDQ